MPISQIISRIDQMVTLGTPLFIFIAGGSCSGKTTLAGELKNHLPTSSVINMDDYFRNIDDPDLPRENGIKSFDNPGSYHLSELIDHLKKFNQRLSILTPTYDVKTNQRTVGKKMVQASNIVIVDGLFAIDLVKRLDINKITVFVDAPYRTRLLRRVARDKQFGLSAEVVEHHFRCEVEPCYQRLVFPQSKVADFIIKNE